MASVFDLNAANSTILYDKDGICVSMTRYSNAVALISLHNDNPELKVVLNVHNDTMGVLDQPMPATGDEIVYPICHSDNYTITVAVANVASLAVVAYEMQKSAYNTAINKYTEYVNTMTDVHISELVEKERDRLMLCLYTQVNEYKTTLLNNKAKAQRYLDANRECNKAICYHSVRQTEYGDYECKWCKKYIAYKPSNVYASELYLGADELPDLLY